MLTCQYPVRCPNRRCRARLTSRRRSPTLRWCRKCYCTVMYCDADETLIGAQRVVRR